MKKTCGIIKFTLSLSVSIFVCTVVTSEANHGYSIPVTSTINLTLYYILSSIVTSQ